MNKPRKVERGYLYLASATGLPVEVKPVDGKKFTLKELQHAVGGFIENMVPSERFAHVYVNEEGVLKNLPLNKCTWEFADKHVYCHLNGYRSDFLVSGNALVVKKVELQPERAVSYDFPTVFQAVRP